MIFNTIAEVIGPRLGLAGLTLRKHSPEIYLVGGIGTGVASAIMLARAHKKSDDVFEDTFENIRLIREYIDTTNTEEDPKLQQIPITNIDAQKMLRPMYIETIKLATRLYGPAVLMGATSVGFILASYGVLRGRNRALFSALTLFERGFATYRQRVVDEYGEEVDERLYYGAEARQVTTMTKGKDGKTKKKKGTKNHIPEKVSPMIYSRQFDETNINWRNDPDMSEFFIRAVQTQMNDYLTLKGYVMLNTVYKSLGFSESPEGAVVGWSKNVPGDDFVSFGMNNDINQRQGDNRWILDFNVNGVVYNQIGEN